MTTPDNPFTLADWRRTVAELYAAVRRAPTAEQPRAWETFRTARDELFRSHPQSPLPPEQRADFAGLAYYPYAPAWRLIGTLDREVERETFALELPADGLIRYTRVARIHFTVGEQPAELSAFWIDGYGGGLFVPFRDASSGEATYGGGRYLYDTIKGADLGVGAERIALDFNYAYNPSCAYNEHWVCPLSPRENQLAFAVQAGEKVFNS
jgi:uncharacterized protein (DUF1684 family)